VAASPHSWDFLLLRLRELRLSLLRGSASGTLGPTAKPLADILPRGGWQSKISRSASPPIYEIGSAIQLALESIIANTQLRPFKAGRHSPPSDRLTQLVVQTRLPLSGLSAQ